MKIKLFTIPNLITLGNLFCGSVGSELTVAHICGENYSLALPFYLMLGSALLDFCDGFAARLLHQYSEVGKELDSLADVVSFGLLPSLLFMALFLEMGGAPAWSLVALIVVLFSALRLAKFGSGVDNNPLHCYVYYNEPDLQRQKLDFPKFLLSLRAVTR